MEIINQNLESKYQNCFETIIDRIDNEKKSLTNRELLEICRRLANFLSGEVKPHFRHEIKDAALNLLISTKYALNLLAADNPTEIVPDLLKPLANRLPTQTWRSREMAVRQQFSTPVAVAYLLAYLLNLDGREQMLEPSARTGNLAVWTSGSKIKTHTNEIDSRRRLLLEQIGFAPTAFNAEFINDFLPTDCAPECVLMNPPFSSSGGRTANNSSKFGFRHVESAFERLKKGGKFGIILGNSAGLNTKTGREFWRKMSGKASVKAIIKIPGAEYAQNGTRVDVNLIIGRKNNFESQPSDSFAPDKIINISVENVESGFVAAKRLGVRLD